MLQRFLLYTTVFLTLITTTEAFQITKIFSQPEKKPKFDDMASEQTFIAVKPDGVMRGLVGEIIARFEKRGYSFLPSCFVFEDNWIIVDLNLLL